jgi:hypothetical protein
MFDIILKIWYFVFIFPFFIAEEGYKKLKKFFARHGLNPDWAYAWLVILLLFLLVVIIFQYGYN